MGSAVRATCKCGYDETFMIGGGMRDFTTVCWFPALCRACSRIVPVNLLSNRPKCPECGSVRIAPYDQDELAEETGNQVVVEWSMKEQIGRDLRLTNGRYYCPSCDSFDLTFADAGICWD